MDGIQKRIDKYFMAKSIKRNFLFNIILNLSKVLFPLISGPYVARVLEPEGVGFFNFANTYSMYFALFAALGISNYGIREIAKIKNDLKLQSVFVSEIFSLSLISTFLCSVLFLGSLFFIPQLNKNFIFFVVSGIVLYITPLKIDWFFSGREEFGYITFRSIIVKTVSLACLFIFVHKKEDLFLYICINVVATIANEVWNFIKLFKVGVRPSFTLHFGKHVKPLLILFGSAVAISVYTILDTIMLGFMREYTEVAFYNSASHISKSLLTVTTSLSVVVMPRISYYKKYEDWNEINSLIKKSFSVVSFLSFPITLGIVVVAPVFIPLFYGSAFEGATLPLQIMIFVVLAIGFSNLTGIQLLLGLGYDKLFLYSVIIGAVLNFMLNLYLIPLHGASGAAFSSVVAETGIFFMMYYFVRLKTKISIKWKKDFFLSLVCASVFFPIGSAFSNFVSGWIWVFSVVLFSSLIYMFLQYLVKNESLMLMKIFLLKKLTRRR